jgi:hypothetical protein
VPEHLRVHPGDAHLGGVLKAMQPAAGIASNC